MQDVEEAFDGNICRCTGYRPILDAFKSTAMDATEELKRRCGGGEDIENCSKCPCALPGGDPPRCKISGGGGVTGGTEGSSTSSGDDNESFDRCSISSTPLYIKVEQSGEEWVKPTDLTKLFEAVSRYAAGGMKYRLVAGNTGTGVFKNDGPYQAYVDVNNVPELKQGMVEHSGVVLGANLTISQGIEMLERAAELDGYKYAGEMAKHWKRVANVPVRNVSEQGWIIFWRIFFVTFL